MALQYCYTNERSYFVSDLFIIKILIVYFTLDSLVFICGLAIQVLFGAFQNEVIVVHTREMMPSFYNHSHLLLFLPMYALEL